MTRASHTHPGFERHRGVVVPPPPSADTFRSDDVDEVREQIERRDGRHSRVVHDAGPYGYVSRLLLAPDAGMVWNRVALAQTIRGVVADPVLHFTFDAANDYAFGRRRVRLAPGGCMFVAPGWEFTRRSGPGAVLGVKIPGAALDAEIEARRPLRARRQAVASQALLLDIREADGLCASLASLATVLSSTGRSPARPAAVAAVVARLVGLLLRGGATEADAGIAPSRLSAVEEWIDAHLAEAITLGSLCRVAGVGERSLQAGFLRRRGVSPMRYVAERRLAEARRRIESEDFETPVTEIAMAVGFTHLSRFASAYREAFGELPSSTRRRGPRVRRSSPRGGCAFRIAGERLSG